MREQEQLTTRASSDGRAVHGYWRAASRAEHVPPKPPWLLSGVAVACAMAVVVGSLGPWLYREWATRTLGTFQTDLLLGWQTDGLFALISAVVAIVAIAIANLRPNSGWVAWIGCAALAVCALIGIYDWNLFGNVAASHEAAHPDNDADLRWGVITVAIAGPIGTVSAFFVARHLNRE